MKVVAGIASTTHVDAHYECFSKEALESGAEQIRSRFLPFLRNHDPSQQIGVILYGRVEPLEDGEYALYFVGGIFESEDERARYVSGAPNTVSQQFASYLDRPRERIRQRPNGEDRSGDDRIENDPNNLAALLETHLDSTSVWIDGRVIKVKHLIASTGDLSVHVYRDHAPPHFHVISRQRRINAKFHLDTLEPIKGSISSNDVKKIKDFFRLRPAALQKLRDEHARMQK